MVWGRRTNRFATTLGALALAAAPALGQVAIEHQKLLASDGSSGDEYGVSVGISGDTMVVGAKNENSSTGAAYVYERQSDGTWAETQKLTAGNAGSGDEFGVWVDVDGDWLAVGARREDSGSSDTGSVYMFERQGGSFVQTQQLQASNRGNGDQFGISLDLAPGRLIVGAVREDSKGNNAGAVYIFEESSGNWSEVAMITASDGGDAEQFGFAVDIDGDIAVVGTVFPDNLTGAAYVIERDGSGNWSEVKKLLASDGAHDDEFGGAVAVSGEIILVSARLEEAVSSNAGSVYAFERNGGSWDETDKFQGSNTGNGDQFGYSVALDGERAIIGAHRADPSGQNNGGIAYVVERRPSGDWVEVARIEPSDPASSDFFGFSSDIEGFRVAIGAVWDDENGTDSGGAYVAESEFLRSAAGISASAGGSVDYYIGLGQDEAGSNYWVLGSVTGIDPGVVLHGVHVPLNWDLYLLMTITKANKNPFTASRGVLDGDGKATMTLTTPPGLDPILVGLQMHHSALTFDNSSGVKFPLREQPDAHHHRELSAPRPVGGLCEHTTTPGRKARGRFLVAIGNPPRGRSIRRRSRPPSG